ncbi:MAG TPA: type II toxin-antitoxin system VapB family antitoxin [Caulobacteraceae bacterium]|jgi:hypothetical protein
MTDAPIQFRRPAVVRAMRELAARTGRPITDAVGDLVQAEVRRLSEVDDAEYRRRRALIHDAVARFQALPVVGPRLTDDDLYDDDGLPK